MAHFMVNKYPERFTVIAVRQSNFSEDLLSSSQTGRYRNMPVAIFFGERDLPVCRKESLEAVNWYQRHHFAVQAKLVSGLGHERTPQTAAAFFGLVIGEKPKSPPQLNLVMKDIPGEMLASGHSSSEPIRRLRPSMPASVAGEPRRLPAEPSNVVFSPPIPPPTYGRTAPTPKRGAVISGQPQESDRPGGASTAPRRAAMPMQPYNSSPQPAPRSPQRPEPAVVPPREGPRPPQAEGRIRIHGDTAGPAPMWVNMTAELPAVLREGASILWTADDQPLNSNTFEAQSVLREPGEHTIEARIITADDQRIILQQKVNVLDPQPPGPQPAGS
jgi:hypothetical protein